METSSREVEGETSSNLLRWEKSKVSKDHFQGGTCNKASGINGYALGRQSAHVLLRHELDRVKLNKLLLVSEHMTILQYRLLVISKASEVLA